MPFALVVAALRLVLHHLDFLTQSGENNGALDLCALDNGRTDGRVRAVVDEEHLAEDNCVTLLQIPRELLYSDNVALRDDILLPASLDYGHFHSRPNVARFYKKESPPKRCFGARAILAHREKREPPDLEDRGGLLG